MMVAIKTESILILDRNNGYPILADEISRYAFVAYSGDDGAWIIIRSIDAYNSVAKSI